MKPIRELVEERMKALGLWKEHEERVDFVASRVQPLINDGCPSVQDAIREALDEAVYGGHKAKRMHGSVFEEA